MEKWAGSRTVTRTVPEHGRNALEQGTETPDTQSARQRNQSDASKTACVKKILRSPHSLKKKKKQEKKMQRISEEEEGEQEEERRLCPQTISRSY